MRKIMFFGAVRWVFFCRVLVGSRAQHIMMTEPQQAACASSGAETDRRYRREHFPQNVDLEYHPSSPEIVEQLLGMSDEMDKVEPVTVVKDDWKEAVMGWKPVVPNPQFTVRPRRRKRAGSVEDSSEPEIAIRCVNDDYDDQEHRAMWKANVEPITYRYISNNALYRTLKFAKEGRIWFSIRRRMPEKLSLKYREEIREKTQLYIKMGREEEKRRKEEERARGTMSEGAPARPYSPEPCILQPLVKSASDLYMEQFSTRLQKLEEELERNSLLPGHKAVEESAHSTGSKSKPREPKPKEAPRPRENKVRQAPMLKNLTANSKVWTKPDDQAAQEAFVIKPVGRPEALRPLEKVTPQQHKVAGDMHKQTAKQQQQQQQQQQHQQQQFLLTLGSQRVHAARPPSAETVEHSAITNVKTTLAMTNFDLDRLRLLPSTATIGPFVLSQDQGGRRHAPGASRGHAHKDGKRAGRNATSPAPTSIDGSEPVPYDDVSSVKGSQKPAAPDMLPEISGKRAHISVVPFRML